MEYDARMDHTLHQEHGESTCFLTTLATMTQSLEGHHAIFLKALAAPKVYLCLMFPPFD